MQKGHGRFVARQARVNRRGFEKDDAKKDKRWEQDFRIRKQVSLRMKLLLPHGFY
jgi:hypothetical protein